MAAPALSSSTSVKVPWGQSHYPPSASLEIFVYTTGEEELRHDLENKITPQTGTIGHDTAAGEEGVGRPPGQNMVARSGSPAASGAVPVQRHGQRGTFSTVAGVHVHVWHMGPRALRTMWVGFHQQLTLEELVVTWRNSRGSLATVDIKRGQHHLAFASGATAEVDVLWSSRALGSLLKLQELASTLLPSAKEMEHSVEFR